MLPPIKEDELSEWEKEFNKKSAHWGMIWWKEMEDEEEES